jgi:fatty acid-binding protein DegV
MDFKIIADSGCDISKELQEKIDIGLVPLRIHIDDNEFIDDENLDVKELLKEMKKSSSTPKTASPSPIDFINKFKEKKRIL